MRETGRRIPRHRRRARMEQVFIPSKTTKSYGVCDEIKKQHKRDGARASDGSAYVSGAQSCSELSSEEGTS